MGDTKFLENYKQYVVQQYALAAEEKIASARLDAEIPTTAANSDQIKFYYGEQIRPQFLETLRRAQHSVMIISPWITKEVVDAAFLKELTRLANNNVLFLIGWGITRDIETDNRPIPQELLEKLHKIQSPDGLPAVNVFWLGNIHNKDFIVNSGIHFSGSHNWLSYRGDRYARGKSVYRVTNPETVQQALDVLNPVFEGAISKLWRESKKNLDEVNLLRCCVAWSCIDRPERALLEIHNMYLHSSEKVDKNFFAKLFLAVINPLVRTNYPDLPESVSYNVGRSLSMFDPRVQKFMKMAGIPLDKLYQRLIHQTNTR